MQDLDGFAASVVRVAAGRQATADSSVVAIRVPRPIA